MLLKETQSTHQKLRRREPAGVEHDPAASSATLRALAVRRSPLGPGDGRNTIAAGV